MHTPDRLIKLRHQLHRRPETAGEEEKTAAAIRSYILENHGDFEIVSDIGGHGIWAKKSFGPGPEIALRAELDALSIRQADGANPRSEVEGKAHLCGHDGHMTMVLDAARKIEESKPEKGTLHLLFQPAEETGEGAQAMLDSGKLQTLDPEVMYALHNIPGYPIGRVLGRDGTFACGSVGVRIDLAGRVAHAAHPEDAANPLTAAAHLMQDLLDMAGGKDFGGFVLATPVGLVSGDGGFGTSPAEARLTLTYRAARADDLKRMMEETEKRVSESAETLGIKGQCTFEEYFPITENPALTDGLKAACGRGGLEFEALKNPFRWSEDFGRFGERFKTYMFGLGSGISQPALHAPDYAFPDELIDAGSSVFYELFKSHTSA